MTKNKENSIHFQITKVETLQFAILQEEVNKSALIIQGGFSFGVDGEAKMIRSVFEYTMSSEEKQVLKIEAAVTFALEPRCFNEIINKDKNWIIPKDFAMHMAMTTVSVTRGILHEKTRNSPLNNFPLPTINVQDAVKDNVIIDKAEQN